MSAPAAPPVAGQRPHTLVAHGHERQDPWFWLRDREDPEVLAYLQAENEYLDASLRHLAELRQALFEEMKARIKETDMSVPVRRGPWWYYGRTEEGKAYAIHCRCPAGPADQLPPRTDHGNEGEQILLDENALAEGHEYFSIGGAEISPDHSWLAYSTDLSGDEKFALQFVALGLEASGTTAAPEVVSDTSYGLAWSTDNAAVFYVRLDEAMRPFQLWRHRLGTDPATDALVYEEQDRRFSLGVGLARDERFVLVALHSTNTTEWLAIPAADPERVPLVIMPRREGVEYGVDHLQSAGVGVAEGTGWFVVTINDAGKDFRVISAPDDSIGDHDGWKEVVPHRPGIRIEGVEALAGALVLSERSQAETNVRVVPLELGDPSTSGLAADIEQSWLVEGQETPSTTWVGANLEAETATLRVGRTSMVTPSSVLQVDLGTRAETLLKQEPVLGDFDPSRYVTMRLWAAGRDGTRIPVSVVHRVGLPLPAPCVLYGYGAYEISIDPAFSHHRLSLLDRGGIFAIAHIRGGGEMGRAWYEDGRMEHKPHTFNDFIDAGRFLVSEGIARGDALAGRGGSAGGLLIGAVANQAPELFRALVAQVPFVDIVTTMLDDELPLTVGEWEEWGNPLADEAAYVRMLSYSPYDNVRSDNDDGTPRTYPDLLVTGGLNDPRVSYWEPAKWVAKVRSLSPSTRIYLRTELGAGHAGPSGRYEAWKEEALVLAFLLDRLGLS